MPVLFSDTKFVLICYSRHEDGCKSLPCEGVRITAAVSFSSVQFSRSVAQSCPTLCDSMNRNSQSSLKLTSIESMMPSSHLILCRPLLLLPPIPPRGNHVGHLGQSRGPPGAITWAPRGNHVGPLGQSRGPPGEITWAPRGSKFGRLSSGHRTGKGQFSFQSQRKEMQKDAQTTAQLHSPHMLVK